MEDQKYFIVRCDRAGVFFGNIKEKSKDSVIMTNVQKIWYWEGACAVEQLALTGPIRPNSCKLTVIIDEMEVFSPIQVIECTNESITTLKNIPIWKQ